MPKVELHNETMPCSFLFRCNLNTELQQQLTDTNIARKGDTHTVWRLYYMTLHKHAILRHKSNYKLTRHTTENKLTNTTAIHYICAKASPENQKNIIMQKM